MSETPPVTKRTRRYYEPPEEVVRAAAQDGVVKDDLLHGAAAAREAGFVGRDPVGALAQARYRGSLTGYRASGRSSRVWYSRQELRTYRELRTDPSPLEETVHQHEAQQPLPSSSPEAQLTAPLWPARDGELGGPVPRVEHELEVENARLRAELDAVSSERDRLAADLARAQRVAAALAEAMASTVADPPNR